MRRNPIPRCVVCNRPIVRMRKIWSTNWVEGVGLVRQYRLAWVTNAKYCSPRCSKRAYRARKLSRSLENVI